MVHLKGVEIDLLHGKNPFDGKPVDENLNNLSQEELLPYAVRILECYIQLNYTGPTEESVENFLALLPNESGSGSKPTEEIVLDGEDLLPDVKYPNVFLHLERIFDKIDVQILPSVSWWRLRSLFLHQRILEERSNILWNKIKSVIEESNNELNWDEAKENGNCTEFNALYHAELVSIYLYYYDSKNAKKHYEVAQRFACIQVETKGIYGKRTKFQQNSLPQLVVHVGTGTVTEAASNIHENDLYYKEFIDSGQPYAVLMNDEVLLENVKLEDDEQDHLLPDISSTQLGVLYTKFYLMTCTEPNDGELFHHECKAYVETLVKKPNSWAILMATLLARSKYERGQVKTFERSMKQFEALKGAVENQSPRPEARMSQFFVAYLPRIREISLRLAQILESLSLFKSALDIYLSMRQWENCITCYMAIDQNSKARELIVNELRKDENSVKFWILLGDVIGQMKPNCDFSEDEFPKDAIECYKHAWELSGQKSAKAMRQLGYYYFVRKQYKDCIEYLLKSVELNPLENPTWLRLGYASIQSGDWKLASKAYLHSTNLDTDNFQVWNNLAKAELHLGDKPRAYQFLKEAIKCNYEAWEVWDNYLGCAVELRDFGEAISAYQKIVSLKNGKYQDEKIIQVLSQAICQNVQDIRGEKSTKKYRKSLLALLAQIINLPPQSSKLCRAYSDVLVSPYYLNEDGQVSSEDRFESLECEIWDKSLANLHKALSRLFLDSNWSKITTKIEETLDCLFSFCNRAVKFQQNFPAEQQCLFYIQMGITDCDKVLTTFQGLARNAVNPDIYQKFIHDIEEHLNNLSKLVITTK